MAYVLTKRPFYTNGPFFGWGMAPGFTNGTIDATGEKYAMVGRFWHPAGPGSYNIRNVGFRFGSVTKSGGSGLTVSLQDVSLTTGSPLQPDETQDQTVAIANGDAGFTSNVWYETGNLSADRTVTHDSLVAAVIEYDGSGRTAPDSVQIGGITSGVGSGGNDHVLKTASWARQSVIPCVVFKCSDGSYGTLLEAVAASALSAHQFDNSDTPDEYANAFTVPFPCKVDAAHGVIVASNSAADFEIRLYNDTTLLDSIAVDGNTLAINAALRPLTLPFGAEVELLPGNTYHLSVIATTATANGVMVAYRDVSTASHLWEGAGSQVSRSDGSGSFGDAVTTRQLLLGLQVSSVSDGAAAAGGSPYIIGG